MNRRWAIAAASLAVIGVVSANLLLEPAAASVAEVAVVATTSAVVEPPPRAPVRLPQSVGRGETVANPFGPLNPGASPATVPIGAPPEKKPAAPTPRAAEAPLSPPPAPTAPPLPFVYMGAISGKDLAGSGPSVFLRQNDDVLVVRAGDEIGRTYRVESVAPDRIEFTYLPLKQKQTLATQ